MKLTKTQKIIISIIIIGILLVLYIAFDRRSKNVPNENTNFSLSTTTTGNTTTKEIGNTGVNISSNGDFKVEQVPNNVPLPIPDLTAKVSFGPNVSMTDEQKQMVEQKVSVLQTALLKNPADFDSWINLGIYRKMTGDYQATIVAWQYAGKLSPTNYISFGDLGDLYAWFLKDTTTAEKYYKQAIANGPTQTYLYIQLAQVYHNIELNSAKALDIINQGLTKIPNDPSLLQYKAGLSQ